MNAQHTPTPWTQRGESVVAQRDHVCGGINEESVHAMTRAPAERIANAAFIVRACNSHDALVDALKLTRPYRIAMGEMTVKAIEDALAAAGEGA